MDVAAVRAEKDLSQTPRAWQDDGSASASKSTGNLLKMLSYRPAADVVTTSEYRGDAVGKQRRSTSSENWTSSEDTPKRDDNVIALAAPDFMQMSHIRSRVLEKYRSVPRVLDLGTLNVKVMNQVVDDVRERR